MIDRSAIRGAGVALVSGSCCLAVPLLVAAGGAASVGAVGELPLAAAAVAMRAVIAGKRDGDSGETRQIRTDHS